MFYKNGKKGINKEILNKLSDLSLAVWMMDDGITYFAHNKKLKTGYNISPEVSLCTDSFSPEENQMICDWLEEKWEIKAHVRESRNRVIINSTSVPDFLFLIHPHIIPSMLYKVDYEEYKKKTSSKAKPYPL